MAARANFAAKERLRGLKSASQLDVDLAKSEADALVAELASVDAKLSYCDVTAPYDGRIARRYVDAHESISQNDPLFDIVGADLRIQVIAPSSWMRWMKAGDPFEIEIEEIGNRYDADVSVIGARVDHASPIGGIVRRIYLRRFRPAAGHERSGRISVPVESMKLEPAENATRSALENLTALLELERMARSSDRSRDLAFMMVNESSRVLPYRTAIHWVRRGRRARIVAISGVSDIDRTAPYVQWLEKSIAYWNRIGEAGPVLDVAGTELPPRLRSNSEDWYPGNALLVRFADRRKSVFAGLLFLRAPGWTDQDKAVGSVLADSYGHALLAVDPKAASRRFRLFTARNILLVSAAAITAAMFIPVRLSVVAPAEVAPRDATIVAAPFASTIDSINVAPNQAVDDGDLLFSLDSTEVRARFEAARQELGVAKAKYRRAVQSAFTDSTDKADVAILLEEIQVKEVELDYNRTLLELRPRCGAESEGVAVYTDPNDWIGKPVSVGERVMLLADPEKTWLEVSVPAADAINLALGADVRFFTNVNPLEPINAIVRQTSFEPQVGPDGVAGYRIKASFQAEDTSPRLGLTGTAKVYGDEVTLFYFLFRRPLSVIRTVPRVLGPAMNPVSGQSEKRLPRLRDDLHLHRFRPGSIRRGTLDHRGLSAEPFFCHRSHAIGDPPALGAGYA